MLHLFATRRRRDLIFLYRILGEKIPTWKAEFPATSLPAKNFDPHSDVKRGGSCPNPNCDVLN